MIELEKEKESLSQELNDYKSKLLKVVGEQIQWEKEKGFLIAKINVLNENQLAFEKEREEKQKDKLKETYHPSTKENTEAIVQAMSQVSLRDEEIKSLKKGNQKLAEIIKKKEEEIKLFENKNKELLNINDKLAKQLSRPPLM